MDLHIIVVKELTKTQEKDMDTNLSSQEILKIQLIIDATYHRLEKIMRNLQDPTIKNASIDNVKKLKSISVEALKLLDVIEENKIKLGMKVDHVRKFKGVLKREEKEIDMLIKMVETESRNEGN